MILDPKFFDIKGLIKEMPFAAAEVPTGKTAEADVAATLVPVADTFVAELNLTAFTIKKVPFSDDEKDLASLFRGAYNRKMTDNDQTWFANLSEKADELLYQGMPR